MTFGRRVGHLVPCVLLVVPALSGPAVGAQPAPADGSVPIVQVVQGAGSAAIPDDTALTFTPVADAWVARAQPTANHGADRRLVADGSPKDAVLIKFDVQGTGPGTVCAAVTGARLTLTVGHAPGSGSTRGGDFYGTGPTRWAEGTVTWNRAPEVSGPPVARITRGVEPDGTYTVDVTPVVTGNGKVTIRIVNTATDGVAYRSKESTHAPTLEVRCAGLSSRVLTPDGSDRYGIGLSGGVIRVSAPATNSGSNLRQVFWPTGESPSSDAQVCATWLDQDGQYVQQGVALRIVDGPSGTRALTVTKNIWAGNYWVFNVHTWDTSQTQPFTQIGQYDLAAVLRAATGAEPFPWRICAKVVDSALTFKVWLPDREAEPAWTDPVHAATTLVPPGFLAAGRAGWYAAHVPPGGGTHYGSLDLWQPPPG